MVKDPLKPVKFKFLVPSVAAPIAKISVPADTFTFKALDSPNAPGLNVRVPTAPEYVQFNVGVPEKTKLVTFDVDQIVVLLAVRVMFPVPKFIVRAFAFADIKRPAVRVKVFKVTTPAVWVNVPAAVHKVGLPDKERVMFPLFCVVLNDAAVACTSTVPDPEFASKFTVSVLFGTPAPPAPPVLDAQFVVVTLFQVPAPPTQKYVAIF